MHPLSSGRVAMLCLVCMSVYRAQVNGSVPQRNLKLHSSMIEETYLRKTEKADRSTSYKGDTKHKESSDDNDDDDYGEMKEKSQSPGSKASSKVSSANKSKSSSARDSHSKAKPTHAPFPVPPKADGKEEKQTPAKKQNGCRRLSKYSSKSKKSSAKRSKMHKYHDDDKAKSERDDDDHGDNYQDKDHDDVDTKRSKSKGDRYDDDYDGHDNNDEKEEKLDDKVDECDDTSDPPETSAPAPAIPASEEDIEIPLDPYFVLYEVEQTKIPLLLEYDELTAFTSSYLDTYFRFIFDSTVEIQYVKSTTSLVGSEFRLAQPVRIDYATNLTFTSTSLIPGASELESMIIGAFEGENGEMYAAAVARGLSANNIFATTDSVSYALAETMPPRLRFSRLGSAMFAAIVALAVLVYRQRSTRGSFNEHKSLENPDEDRQMRNITAGWKAGIVPVLASMKGEKVAYKTVESTTEIASS